MRSLKTIQSVGHSYVEDTDNIVDLHRDCFACGHGKDSLGLVFEKNGVDTVSAEWFCEEKYQSYPGIVHGGIIATMLDCAMTNCLLLKGISAVTADMHIKYRKPVIIGSTVTITASLIRARAPLFILEAEITQSETVCAKAEAEFMRADVWSEESRV